MTVSVDRHLLTVNGTTTVRAARHGQRSPPYDSEGCGKEVSEYLQVRTVARARSLPAGTAVDRTSSATSSQSPAAGTHGR
jgi:hypothetical protein